MKKIFNEKELGKCARKIREKKGLSKADAAGQFGVVERTIERMECGEFKEIDRIMDYFNFLGCTVSVTLNKNKTSRYIFTVEECGASSMVNAIETPVLEKKNSFDGETEYNKRRLLQKAYCLESRSLYGMFELFSDKRSLSIDKMYSKTKISIGVLFVAILVFLTFVFDIDTLKGTFGCFFVGYLTFLISMKKEIKNLNKAIFQEEKECE